MTNLFVLLCSWVMTWLVFLIAIPLLLILGVLNGLYRNLKSIKNLIHKKFPDSSLIGLLLITLFMLFPFFMIPIYCYVLHKKNKKLSLFDIT